MARHTLCLAVTHAVAARENMMGRRWKIGDWNTVHSAGTTSHPIIQYIQYYYNTDMRGSGEGMVGRVGDGNRVVRHCNSSITDIIYIKYFIVIG